MDGRREKCEVGNGGGRREKWEVGEGGEHGERNVR